VGKDTKNKMKRKTFTEKESKKAGAKIVKFRH